MPHKYGRPRYNRRRMGKPRKDKGKKHKHSAEYLAQRAELNKPIVIEITEKDVYIPRQKQTLTRYVMMFNWYGRAYEYYKDGELAIYSVQNKFRVTAKTVYQAVRCGKFLQQEKIRREKELEKLNSTISP